MIRYFIHIGYDGSVYSGWQRQNNTQNTIQEWIENTLYKIFKSKVTVYGCGRTDAGVHASQYVFHIDLPEAPSFDLKFRLNKNLPNDISVFEIIEVKGNQHCQHNAVIRSYDYFIHLTNDPALHRHSSFYGYLELDLDNMKKVTSLFLNTNDFRPLCKHPDLYKNTLCHIKNCDLFVNEHQGRLQFKITSNRFLRGMVRYCVFTILQIGLGNMTILELQQILHQEKKFSEKRLALPNGLFLSKIEYPFVELKDVHQLIKILKVGLEY